MKLKLILTMILGFLLAEQGEIARAQALEFDPDTAVLLDSVPTNQDYTYYSITGVAAPLPFLPNPAQSLYYDGTTNVLWYDDTRLFMTEDFPDLPPGGSGGDTNSTPNPSFNIPTFVMTTNLWQYTNFWLTLNASATNSQVGLVTVVDTLSGYYYSILTNADLNTNGWNTWNTLLATGTNTAAPPIGLNQTNLNFRGKIVLPSGSYLTNGLVAYWKLNDASGTNALDSSGHENRLTLTNSPYWGPGNLILNGTNQFGNAGTNAAEIVTNDMTVCAWIKQDFLARRGILDKSYYSPGTGGKGWGLWVHSDGHLIFIAQNSCYDTGPAVVIPGQWTFVTAVYHYATQVVDFYLNGLLNTNLQNSGVVNLSTQGLANMQVGNLENNLSDGQYSFNGSIRDAAVYNRALSISEVHSNYLATEYNTNVSLPGVLYYKMTEYNPANPTNNPFSLTDSSVHGGTTGTYEGAISEIWITNVASLPNTALHFSGAGAHIDTSNSVLFNFTTNSFTINLWACPNSSSEHYLAQNLDDATNNGWYIYYDSIYAASFGMVSNGNISSLYTYSGTVQNSNWDMVTVVRSGTNAMIYVNGSLATSGTIANAGSSTNSLKFGIGPPHGTNDYDGNIWLPQIWTNALSPVDVGNLYQEQLLGRPWP